MFDPRAAPGSLFRGAGDHDLELAADLETLNRCLTTALAQGEGVDGIASVLHASTGRSIVIWDANGLALAAGGEAGASTAPRRFRRGTAEVSPDDHARAVREGDQLVVPCCPAGEVLGSVTMADPHTTAAIGDVVGLEMAAAVLAVELFRLRSVAEAELRLWDDLASELLADGDVAAMCEHARALGHDTTRPHRALVAICAPEECQEVATLVRSAARQLGLQPGLLARRGDHVVLLVDAERDWSHLLRTIDAEGTGRRLGVGELHPAGRFGASAAEAQMALQLIDQPLARFEALGVWRFLAPGGDAAALRGYIDQWIGSLAEYDAAHDAELVETLSVYLKLCGAATEAARRLHIHISTLKYRLARIAEVTGRDLRDPEDRFNLDLACRARATLAALDRGES